MTLESDKHLRLRENQYFGLFEAQKDYAVQLRKQSVESRISKLKRLESAILKYRRQFQQALLDDLRKPFVESDLTEIRPVLGEIELYCSKLSQWVQPQTVKTPLILQGTKNKIYPMPKGQVLILSPWNYPINLSLVPLVNALGAGNTVVLRPSEHSPNVSRLIHKMISETFSEKEVAVVLGEIPETKALLELPFHHVFFTGSTPVGKIVMRAAAENLSDVTLELGGKSPTIVDQSANLDVAASKITWGKNLNAGQSCLAPDYVFVHESVAQNLIKKLKTEIRNQLGATPDQIRDSEDFGRIINDNHWARLMNVFDRALEFGDEVVFGGDFDKETRYIAPTLVLSRPGSPLMEDELFGPLLPILTYKSIEDVFRYIEDNPRPLGAYLFSRDAEIKQRFNRDIVCGGACINETFLHMANHNLPFGGVNGSGIGAYHGHRGFLELSHQKAVCERKYDLASSYLYPPFTDQKKKLIDKLMGKWGRLLG